MRLYRVTLLIAGCFLFQSCVPANSDHSKNKSKASTELKSSPPAPKSSDSEIRFIKARFDSFDPYNPDIFKEKYDQIYQSYLNLKTQKDPNLVDITKLITALKSNPNIELRDLEEIISLASQHEYEIEKNKLIKANQAEFHKFIKKFNQLNSSP